MLQSRRRRRLISAFHGMRRENITMKEAWGEFNDVCRKTTGHSRIVCRGNVATPRRGAFQLDCDAFETGSDSSKTSVFFHLLGTMCTGSYSSCKFRCSTLISWRNDDGSGAAASR